jgi:hypothetical protein
VYLVATYQTLKWSRFYFWQEAVEKQIDSDNKSKEAIVRMVVAEQQRQSVRVLVSYEKNRIKICITVCESVYLSQINRRQFWKRESLLIINWSIYDFFSQHHDGGQRNHKELKTTVKPVSKGHLRDKEKVVF